MRYLIDANSFLTPFKQYYLMDLFPGYWNKLADFSSDKLILCDHVKNELIVTSDEDKKDNMQLWIEQEFSGDFISEYTQEVVEIWQQVMEYVNDSPLYRDSAFENWSQSTVADPWLVAIAKVHGLTVVSLEVRNGNLNTGSPVKNVKLPDACDIFEVRYITLQEMLREVEFVL